MNKTKIKFDLKLSSTFSGTLEYEREVYGETNLPSNIIKYDIVFKEGKITDVFIYFDKYGHNGKTIREVKWTKGDKWNNKFWVKAPEYCHFDDCSWTRKQITFHPNEVISSMNHHGTNYSSIITKMVV